MGGNITSTEKIGIFGDWSQYYIFDRVGFTIRRNDSLYMGELENLREFTADDFTSIGLN